MELTREQRAAAEACGCALVPATEEQVRRLTMQRRVFRLDGEPVLATRDGGYFEEPAGEAAEPGPPRDGAAMSASNAEAEVATPVEGTGAEGGAAPARLRAARTPRQRRAGEPKTPRWVTAGKERRGRLK